MYYVFLEGQDDEFFFSYMIDHFCSSISEYKPIKYASMKKDKVNNFLLSIKHIPGSDYVFISDSDGMTTSERKDYLIEKYRELEFSKIVIVRYEIESWYYSGITQKKCKELKLKNFEFFTESLTKEKFENKITDISDRSFILSEMMNSFSPDYACQRNNSFQTYYHDRILAM